MFSPLQRLRFCLHTGAFHSQACFEMQSQLSVALFSVALILFSLSAASEGLSTLCDEAIMKKCPNGRRSTNLSSGQTLRGFLRDLPLILLRHVEFLWRFISFIYSFITLGVAVLGGLICALWLFRCFTSCLATRGNILHSAGSRYS